MPDDKLSEGAAVPPPAAPTITLTFAGPGQAAVSLRAEGISPAQLYAAAWYLEAVAREVRAGEVTQAALGGGLDPSLQRVAMDIMAGRQSRRS